MLAFGLRLLQASAPVVQENCIGFRGVHAPSAAQRLLRPGVYAGLRAARKLSVEARERASRNILWITTRPGEAT